MKLIISAFRAENDAATNAMRTTELVRMVMSAGYTPELAIGHWKGQREIAVIVRGSDSIASLMACGQRWMKAFMQECCYLEFDGQGSRVDCNVLPDGTIIKGLCRHSLGRELTTLCATWQGPMPDCYTETLDGRMIVAKEGL